MEEEVTLVVKFPKEWVVGRMEPEEELLEQQEGIEVVGMKLEEFQ